MSRIKLLDVVAITSDIPKHNLYRGEIGAVVECYPGDAYEVEFVAQDGYTYALVTLQTPPPTADSPTPSGPTPLAPEKGYLGPTPMPPQRVPLPR